MIIVIVDFDNFFGTDVEKLNKEDLEIALTDIIFKCEELFIDFKSIQIRLYGGWYHEVTLTKQASVIQQVLSQISLFPKIKDGRIIKGSVELTSTLFDIPNHRWQYTYKEKYGIPRIRLDHTKVDLTCKSNKELCPKFLLYKFTQKKDKKCHVNGCDQLHNNVFKGIEQKMVDTMIACDVVSTAKDLDVKGVFILSDDQDHFPSYAIAGNSTTIKDKVVVGYRNRNSQRFDLMSRLLEPFNIKIITV